ncbi:acyltransferase family protein [Methyloligella sp. 2.7D]|uniref:acyltransferase family protein n=1 Tax=unclassified Methyloligella TaxID=2625955 RepID=UPI00157C4271|nr:acyltransferase family protein [Methyloligella sp. GL2]QKP77647.1 acyltransferase [Methyloligella sp. GL2]
MQPLRYRPEIDGLRAVAVVPVILFHAGVPYLQGGYLGVDIFFVISGYLITSIIAKDIEAGTFSFAGFYERRARRILPALFLICAASTVLGYLVMSPFALTELGESMVAVSLFLSNVYFYLRTDYFATAAELTPLLHTWSLAVEEQYYIVFPVLLIALTSIRRIGLRTALLVLAAISLASAAYTVRTNPALDFFALHTRGWELLLGALIALSAESLARVPERLRNALALLGLAVSIVCFTVFDAETPHPGLISLVPVGAAGLIVAFAAKENAAGRLLATPLLVGIGLISYSLYLWHQPLFAFYRLYLGQPVGPVALLPLIALSVLLAYLSWRFVERPFRNREWIPRPRLVQVSVVFLALPLAVGLGLQQADGLPGRFGPEAQRIFAQIQDGVRTRYEGVRLGTCHYNPSHSGPFPEFLADWDCLSGSHPSLLLYGDSHGADTAWSLRTQGVAVGNIGGVACPLYPTPTRPECLAMMRKAVGLAKAGKVSGILLANSWGKEDLEPDNLKAMTAFWEQADVPILIFSQMPEFTYLRERLAAHALHGAPLTDIDYDREKLARIDTILQGLAESPNITVISKRLSFCGNAAGRCVAFVEGTPLLIDSGHLAPLGAERTGAHIVQDPVWQDWVRKVTALEVAGKSDGEEPH